MQTVLHPLSVGKATHVFPMVHAMLQTHTLAPLAGDEEARMAKRKVDARIVSFMVVDEVKVDWIFRSSWSWCRI